VTYRDFCFWMQGFFELADPKFLTAEQVELVKRHLNMVFVHERPTNITKSIDGSTAKMRC
jgi:hypothetical protein